MSDAPTPDGRGRPRRGTWLAVAAIVVGVGLLVWALRPMGYAQFGWFTYAQPSETMLTIETTPPELVAAATLAGPLLVGLGAGFLLGRRRG
ncbi:hypothetical protein GCM10009809_14030 [Isoptericola hypogeus]|uniref:PEP-CTERM protein-sorting domain-containing protein n=1 Tax=Isoptericola hypogeus TaxID=300179 RepID=A0ABP4V807_9MICO